MQYAAFIQKSSTLGPGGRGYYELYAVRNKTLVLKFARVDAVLDLRKTCCARLTPKLVYHYLHHDLIMLQLLWMFFAHLLILEDLDHHQKLIRSSLYYPGPLHKISSQSIHNFLSNVHKQTNQRYQKHNLLLPRR